MTGERIGVLCEANGCQLKPVMNGLCLFHSRIEMRYWTEVTRFLNSPEGSKVLAKARKVRMLWALCVFNEFERYHSSDEHAFNTHEAFREVWRGLKRNDALPEEVANVTEEEALDKFKHGWFEWKEPTGEKKYWTFDDTCFNYERLLIKYVAERAGRKE